MYFVFVLICETCINVVTWVVVFVSAVFEYIRDIVVVSICVFHSVHQRVCRVCRVCVVSTSLFNSTIFNHKLIVSVVVRHVTTHCRCVRVLSLIKYKNRRRKYSAFEVVVECLYPLLDSNCSELYPTNLPTSECDFL